MLSCPPLPSTSRQPLSTPHLHTIPFHPNQHSALTAQLDSPEGAQAKKRRIDRACDACRRKKTRCDGPWTENNVCSNCVQSKKRCTYIESSKPRGPPKAYVVGLEDRVEELEALLAQIRPGVDFSKELGPPVIRDSWKDFDDDGQRKKKSNASTKTAAAQDAAGRSSVTSSSATPISASLPPLIIPFHQEDAPGGPSPIAKTTHLHFGSVKPKKRRSPATSDKTTSTASSPSAGVSDSKPRSPSSMSHTTDTEGLSDDVSDSDSELLIETSLAGRNPMTLRTNSDGPKTQTNAITFHGRSSTAALVEATRIFKHMHMQESMKMEVAPEEPTQHDVSGQQPELSPSQSSGKSQGAKPKVEAPENSRIAGTRRLQFWTTPSWELETESSKPGSISAGVVARFPPPDLCETLIDLYFLRVNVNFPLLHRPTFERQWAEKLQNEDFWFAACCLMIFSVASRWCTDERVLRDNEDDRQPTDHYPPHEQEASSDNKGEDYREKPSREQHDSHGKRWWTAGLSFFDAGAEVIRANANMVHATSLFEVQTLAIMGMYLRATSSFPAAWVIVSIALRRAVDAGAHRKRIYKDSPTIEDELWKRAFWHLVVFDRIGGVVLGRSVGIGEEDFDVDFPLEVDDPYWGDDHGWKQPHDVPAIGTSAFNCLIKLTQIVAFTARTIYAVNKTKIFSGLIKGDWRREVVTQLNTALEEWIESVPTHLKWSEDKTDPTLYNLSATLFTTYHLTRLLIYRPFIPPPPLLPASLSHQGPSASYPAPPFPALAICLSSARVCTRVLEHQMQKGSWDYLHIPQFANAAFTCAGVFLLALWDLKGQQKALLKLHGAGVINPATGQVPDDRQDSKPPISKTEVEDVDTQHLLQSLQRKMEELLVDIHLLIDALEWVEPRWQFVSDLLTQLKASLPEQADLEFIAPPPPAPRRPEVVTSRKGSFKDLRKQRQQQKGKKAFFSDELGMSIRASHPAFHTTNEPTQIDLRRSSTLGHQSLGQGSTDTTRPSVFLPENFSRLHTMTDDDHDSSAQESRIQLSRVQYDASPLDGGSGRFLSEQTHQMRQGYSASPLASIHHAPSSANGMLRDQEVHRRSPYNSEDVQLSRVQPHQGLYARDDYIHQPSVSVPYISGGPARRSSMVNLGAHHDPRNTELNRAGGTRTPSYEHLRTDTLPPRFRPTSNNHGRSSISMDRSTIEEDRKPLLLASPNSRRHPEDNPYYQDRHPTLRPEVHSPYSSTFHSDVELRYPWEASETPDRPHPAHNPSPTSYSPPHTEQWKLRPVHPHHPQYQQQQNPPQHQHPHQHDPSSHQPKYAAAYDLRQYHPMPLNEQPLDMASRQDDHRHQMIYAQPSQDPSMAGPSYGRPHQSLSYDPSNYHHGGP